jgi:hypothetical protein
LTSRARTATRLPSTGASAIRALFVFLQAAALSCALASTAAAAEHVDELDANQTVSQSVVDVAGWAIATKDHGRLPFAVVDKQAAQIFVFDAEGRLRGIAPVLLGSAVGDHSAPGVGDRELADIPQADRTTPAGRFFAGYGPALGVKEALWIDYATAVSLHPIMNTADGKRRRRWIASPTPDDNRVTHGCINVSPDFYRRIVQPVLGRQAIFYVLPDEMTLAEALPGFDPPEQQLALAREDDSASPARPRPAQKRRAPPRRR